MITPQIDAPELAKRLGLERLSFKREDLHPYGSHKGRSIPAMIDMKVAEGATDFAISSSGNAALAAVRHVQKHNEEADALTVKKGTTPSKGITLSVLVGGNIDKDKLSRLRSEIRDPRVTLEETPRPLQTLFRLIKSDGKTSLRQSTDDEALIGYRTLAAELAATPDLAAVFIGTSSGTTAQAVADYFAEYSKKTGFALPQVHIVQTTNTSPLAREFSTEENEPETSLADAIIDKVVHRRDAVTDAIKNTGGSGWIASNADIKKAQAMLQETGIEATGNGALGFAGLLKALSKGQTFKGSVVCIITGK